MESFPSSLYDFSLLLLCFLFVSLSLSLSLSLCLYLVASISLSLSLCLYLFVSISFSLSVYLYLFVSISFSLTTPFKQSWQPISLIILPAANASLNQISRAIFSSSVSAFSIFLSSSFSAFSFFLSSSAFSISLSSSFYLYFSSVGKLSPNASLNIVNLFHYVHLRISLCMRQFFFRIKVVVSPPPQTRAHARLPM